MTTKTKTPVIKTKKARFLKVTQKEAITARYKFEDYLTEKIGKEAIGLFNDLTILETFVGHELNENGKKWVKSARRAYRKL